MHPAISVIFFTVLSGAGFGAIFWLGLGMPVRDGMASHVVPVIAGGLAVAGLVASTFHLGRPERAWRALSQWRTSWLSREGVLALACLGVFGVYTLAWWLAGARLAVLGLAASALAVATVVATAMIYAQLRTVALWNRRLTPATYLAFAAASGFLLAAGLGGAVAGRVAGAAAAVFLLIAWGLKQLWWRQGAADTLGVRGTDAGTATGLGHLGKVRLLDRPHSGENYLTREMAFRVARRHAAKLRLIALGAGGVAPLAISLLVALFALPPWPLAAAGLLMIGGLFAERWLFFAEAKHSVSLYYD